MICVPDESGSGREKRFAEKLPDLAKEVARVETVRAYAGFVALCICVLNQFFFFCSHYREISAFCFIALLDFVISVQNKKQLQDLLFAGVNPCSVIFPLRLEDFVCFFGKNNFFTSHYKLNTSFTMSFDEK